MSRVNITLPDELYNRARVSGLNISRLAQTAVADELDRHAKQAELDAYLSELEVELGPIPAAERMQAKQWADRAFDQLPQQRSA